MKRGFYSQKCLKTPGSHLPPPVSPVPGGSAAPSLPRGGGVGKSCSQVGGVAAQPGLSPTRAWAALSAILPWLSKAQLPNPKGGGQSHSPWDHRAGHPGATGLGLNPGLGLSYLICETRVASPAAQGPPGGQMPRKPLGQVPADRNPVGCCCCCCGVAASLSLSTRRHRPGEMHEPESKANSSHQTGQCRDGSLCFKNPAPQWHVDYRSHRAESEDTLGWGRGACWELFGGEVSITSHFFRS